MLDLIWVSSVLMVCSSLLFTESGGSTGMSTEGRELDANTRP